MFFTPEQKAALSAKLDGSHVRERAQAGRKFSYIEGWHAIAEANRIFGFDCWDRETVDLRQLGEPREVDGKWRVAYMAKTRITVRANEMPIVREGCGYGSGIDRDLGSAHESAIKEAETDAMKRALMTFGNPFGLALYDKEQANVTNGDHSTGTAAAPLSASDAWASQAIQAIQSLRTMKALKNWAAISKPHLDVLPDDLKARVREAYTKQSDELRKDAA